MSVFTLQTNANCCFDATENHRNTHTHTQKHFSKSGRAIPRRAMMLSIPRRGGGVPQPPLHPKFAWNLATPRCYMPDAKFQTERGREVWSLREGGGRGWWCCKPLRAHWYSAKPCDHHNPQQPAPSRSPSAPSPSPLPFPWPLMELPITAVDVIRVHSPQTGSARYSPLTRPTHHPGKRYRKCSAKCNQPRVFHPLFFFVVAPSR